MLRFAILASLAVFALPAAPALAQEEAGECAALAGAAYDDWTFSDALADCAKSGDARSEAVLGMMYWGGSEYGSCREADCLIGEYDGPGLPAGTTVGQAQKEGRRLLESAAAKDDSEAINELGQAHLNGEYGQAHNPELALDWLKRSSDLGDRIGPWNMARIHFGGLGVPKSLEEGERYLRLSALRGYEPARCSFYALLEKRGDGLEAYLMRMSDSFRGQVCYPFMLMDELP